jgi:hypothetical protein
MVYDAPLPSVVVDMLKVLCLFSLNISYIVYDDTSPPPRHVIVEQVCTLCKSSTILFGSLQLKMNIIFKDPHNTCKISMR